MIDTKKPALKTLVFSKSNDNPKALIKTHMTKAYHKDIQYINMTVT